MFAVIRIRCVMRINSGFHRNNTKRPNESRCNKGAESNMITHKILLLLLPLSEGFIIVNIIEFTSYTLSTVLKVFE